MTLDSMFADFTYVAYARTVGSLTTSLATRSSWIVGVSPSVSKKSVQVVASGGVEIGTDVFHR